jgi:predicted acylesterase/phospholipase RssA
MYHGRCGFGLSNNVGCDMKIDPKAEKAICLGGGGPAAGLHIGVLKGLKDAGVEFNKAADVWALSCIGAWVGVVYNQANPGNEIEQTYEFFRDVFRDDKSFESFPTNTIFAPDWAGNAEAIWDFLLEPKHYKNAFLPREIMKSFMETMSALRGMSAVRRLRKQNSDYEVEFAEFNEGDFNRWTLNHVLAVHPAVRFWTALLYKSDVTGLSRLHYPNSRFLNRINFGSLKDEKKPFIYHNAWNLTEQKLVLFANRSEKGKPKEDTDMETGVRTERYRSPINAASLCACSALPFIEQTVKINGHDYCEGALVHTMNFEHLLDDNPNLKEIWISRIIDLNQILPPRNLYESLANLCEMFAGTVGADDCQLLKCRLEREQRNLREKEKDLDEGGKERLKKVTEILDRLGRIKIIEIPVSSDINFEWSHSNLERGIEHGKRAAKLAVEALDKAGENVTIITVPYTHVEEMRKQRRATAAGRGRPSPP